MIILCVLTAAIYPFAHDLIIWLNWISAPIYWVKEAVASLALSVVGACAIYVFFAWLGSIPGEDPRQPK
jgi:hypothetical protein